MARYERFTFLVNKDERKMIEELASRLQRSQSDAVRVVLRSAHAEIKSQEEPTITHQGKQVIQHATAPCQ